MKRIICSILHKLPKKGRLKGRRRPSKGKDLSSKIINPNNAGAGPSKEMNIIDLTSDNDTDDESPEASPIEDDEEDTDFLDDDVPLPRQGQPASQRKPNSNSVAASRSAPAAAPLQPPAFVPPSPSPDQQQNAFGANDIWGDYVDYPLDVFDDDNIAGVFARLDSELPKALIPVAEPEIAQPVANMPRPAAIAVEESKDECFSTLLDIFPGICAEHVSDLYDSVSRSSDRLISYILDKMEKGSVYPKANDKQKSLKRKRENDEEEDATLKYSASDRQGPLSTESRQYIRRILQYEFRATPMIFVDATLDQSQYRLHQAYQVLEEAERTYDPNNPPYFKIQKVRRSLPEFHKRNLEDTIASISEDQPRVEILRELQAVRRLREKADEKRELELQAERDEEANLQNAIVDGTMSECGCCFSDFPLNRMIHCNADILHWFCKGCARQNAETEIGNSKYELHCMSTEECEGGFSEDQRIQFLDQKTMIALERNEQEAVLRMAGIENLASCPFCPYAAEYPPVEENKEFRCEAPDCQKVSCRLCKLESHIPKSCEEFAKENGQSIRRQIEEAMSAALIRNCNKCGTPFVKTEGCNKMTCTRNGCFNVQCYVCSKSCSYDHFDDLNRGGKKGNCPLFDHRGVENRHDGDVSKAEKEALAKIRAEHPEFTEEDLKIQISDKVLKEDEEQRKFARYPRVHFEAMPFLGVPNVMNAGGALPVLRPQHFPNPAHLLREPPQLYLNHPFRADWVRQPQLVQGPGYGAVAGVQPPRAEDLPIPQGWPFGDDDDLIRFWNDGQPLQQ